MDPGLLDAVGKASVSAVTGLVIRSSAPAWKRLIARLKPDPKIIRRNPLWSQVKMNNDVLSVVESYLDSRECRGIMQILAYVYVNENENDATEYEFQKKRLGEAFETELIRRLQGVTDEAEEVSIALWETTSSCVEMYGAELRHTRIATAVANRQMLTHILSRRTDVGPSQVNLEQRRPRRGTKSRTIATVIPERAELSKGYERTSKALALAQEVRRSASQMYRTITMPHAREHYMVPIDDIYISRVVENYRTDHGISGAVEDIGRPRGTLPPSALDDFWSRNQAALGGMLPDEPAVSEDDLDDQRYVLLGNPGAGKSTFLRRLLFQQCNDTSDRDIAPFYVELKTYPVATPAPFYELIASQLTAMQHIATTPEVVRDVFVLGYGLVIFDGLDEITDLTYRRQVVDAIDSFARQFPLARVIVSSRETGYSGARLPSHFSTYILPDFTEGQVAEYSHRWFSLMPSAEDSTAMADQFLTDSRSAEDLRSNPLMLSLLCMLYRYAGFIPENRARVYEECSELLFWRWDRIRHIGVAISAENKAHYLMQELGYMFFTTQTTQAGVEESVLRHILKVYLKRNVVSDDREAQSMAEAFLDYCAGRAWLLTKIGTSGRGERLFGFTHRTFMEYFAACYIVRSNPKVSDLVNVLRKLIGSGASEVIPQIAIQRYDDAVVDGLDDCILMLLFNSLTITSHPHGEYLPFILRCFAFMRPSPRVAQLIVTATFQNYGYVRDFDDFNLLSTSLADAEQSITGFCTEMVTKFSLANATREERDAACGCYVFLTTQDGDWAETLSQTLGTELSTDPEWLSGHFPEVLASCLLREIIGLNVYLAVNSPASLIKYGTSIKTRRINWKGPFAEALEISLSQPEPLDIVVESICRLFGNPSTLLPLDEKTFEMMTEATGLSGQEYPWPTADLSYEFASCLRGFVATIILAEIELKPEPEPGPDISSWLKDISPGSMAMTTLIRNLRDARWKTGKLANAGLKRVSQIGLTQEWCSFVENWGRGEVSVLDRPAADRSGLRT